MLLVQERPTSLWVMTFVLIEGFAFLYLFFINSRTIVMKYPALPYFRASALALALASAVLFYVSSFFLTSIDASFIRRRSSLGIRTPYHTVASLPQQLYSLQ